MIKRQSNLEVVLESLDWIGRIATTYSLFRLARFIKRSDLALNLIHVFRYNISALFGHVTRIILKTTRHGLVECNFRSSIIEWLVLTGDLETAIMEIRTGVPFPKPIIEVPDACVLEEPSVCKIWTC